MFKEDSLFWVFPFSRDSFLLVVACEALPNEDFEVEMAVFAGVQCGKTINWVDSFAVDDCGIDDEESLYEYAAMLAENPSVKEKASRIVKI